MDARRIRDSSLTILRFTALFLFLTIGADILLRKLVDNSSLAWNGAKPYETPLECYKAIEPWEDGIEYNGRWLPSQNRRGMEASFGGSNFEFTVTNTTFVDIEFHGLASVPRTTAQNSEHNANDPLDLILTPRSQFPDKDVSVSFLCFINGSADAKYHRNWLAFTRLANGLNPTAVHTFKISLPYKNQSAVFQFRGLETSHGAQLLLPRMKRSTRRQSETGRTQHNRTLIVGPIDTPIQRKLIEVMSPHFLLNDDNFPGDDNRQLINQTFGWASLIQDNFSNSTVSTLPISSSDCLTSRCKGINNRPQDTFFRSGPPGTRLHSGLWQFSSTDSFPYALVLSLGLSDVESFLSSEISGKHDISSFTDDFAHQYSSFIKTIRRAAYSPSTLADIRAVGQQMLMIPGDQEKDESYLYNSAPSIIPIFLVLPPVPSPLLVSESRGIKSLLHHATSKVIAELKLHIGDKHTYLIDTSGWLDDSDFVPVRKQPSSVNVSPQGQSIVTSAIDFTLTQSGHIKVAHHLSLHLCPYLGELGGGKACPFVKHGDYNGNLYVPEVESIGKVIEEKRVERVKELFGISAGLVHARRMGLVQVGK